MVVRKRRGDDGAELGHVRTLVAGLPVDTELLKGCMLAACTRGLNVTIR